MDIKKQNRLNSINAIIASLIGIVFGLVFGFIVLLIANPRLAIPGIIRMLISPIANGMNSIGSVLYYSTTFIICAQSVAFAANSGCFNIGVSGQYIVGSFMACLVGVRLSYLPSFVVIPLAVICAMAAGAFWGAILGALKSLFNISEIVVSILLNYVALYMVNALILKSTIYDSLRNRTIPIMGNSIMPRAGFDKLFPYAGVDLGLYIAILFAIIMYFILNKTVFGYEIKLCGYNKDAALYTGVNTHKVNILTMAIAGALPAIAGAFWHLSVAMNVISVVEIIPSAPMNGLSASLLAMGHPIGIIFTGLFIAYITVGGVNLQVFGYVPEIVSVVTGAIIYCSAFVMVIRMIIRNTGTNLLRRWKPGGNKEVEP